MTAAEHRRTWALALISRCPSPPPRYGSLEFLALPDGPEKVASCVIAAEAWALDGEHLAERIGTDLQLDREAHKRAEDADYRARVEAHRRAWTGTGLRADPVMAAEIEAEWTEWARGERV